MTDTRHSGSESSERGEDRASEDRARELGEAVRDVPDPEQGPVTPEVVETLREAELDELAEVAELYV